MKYIAAIAFALLVACSPLEAEDCGDLAPVPYRDMTICVTPDVYEVDGVRMPVDLREAHRIANELGMRLPTPEMVDAIWEAADVRLTPIYMTPDGTMTTMPVFIEHDRLIDEQLGDREGLIAGHKKTIVDHPVDSATVAIYGWFHPNGVRVQPYNARDHGWDYRDYSHGLRLVAPYGIRDGERVPLE